MRENDQWELGPMLKRIAKCAVCAFGLFTMLAVIASVMMFFAASWLRTSEYPHHADAIIVLAGSFERSFYAADLYHQRYAPKVYVSIPARAPVEAQLAALGITLQDDAAEVHKLILLKKGVPAADILTFGSGSLSTVEEAAALKTLFAKPSIRLLVVTSPFHVRRARMIFDRAFGRFSENIAIVATPYEEYRDDWWRSQDSARNTVLEIAKIVYHWVGGSFYSGAHP
jgi:uncharacterized SAM-binding protein YcdF (DUF218 family)